MKYSYVSLLTTDDYLVGLMVLLYSLTEAQSRYECLVLLTPNISRRTRSILAAHSVQYKVIGTITNPTDVNIAHRWFRTYSKLHVFNQVQFDKVVYLDADMLVLENIDALFSCPHMSATNAGGRLPENVGWTDLNSGLFVAAPSESVFEDMQAQVGRIEVLASGGSADTPRRGSEQDFVNAYYRDWTRRTELHLDHKYNMLHYHINAYNARFGYTLSAGPSQVAVIHYASGVKPWTLRRDVIGRLRSGVDLTLEDQALRLWMSAYDRMLEAPSQSRG